MGTTGELYTFLRDELGAGFIQFIPIIERATPETFEVADTGWGHGVHGRPLYVQDGSWSPIDRSAPSSTGAS